METVARRQSYIETLQDDPLTKPVIVDRLDASRSTVDRAIRELEDLRLVRRTPDGFVTTLLGSVCLSEYQSYADHMETVSVSSEVMSALPDDCSFTTELLEESEVVVAEPSMPDRPLNRAVEILKRSDRVRGLSPVALKRYVDTCHDQLVEDALEADFVLSERAAETLVTNYSKELDEALRSGNLSVSVADGPLPYGLLVADRGEGPLVALLAHTDTGLRGLLGSTSEDAVAWAEGIYDRYCSRSRDLSR